MLFGEILCGKDVSEVAFHLTSPSHYGNVLK
jgi:hypothetical protein